MRVGIVFPIIATISPKTPPNQNPICREKVSSKNHENERFQFVGKRFPAEHGQEPFPQNLVLGALDTIVFVACTLVSHILRNLKLPN